MSDQNAECNLSIYYDVGGWQHKRLGGWQHKRPHPFGVEYDDAAQYDGCTEPYKEPR